MYPGPSARDLIAARARRHLYDIKNRYCMDHQAEFWLALEGKLLTTEILHTWEHDPDNNVRDEKPTFEQEHFDVLIARYAAYREIKDAEGNITDIERRTVTSDEFWILNPPDHYLEHGPTWKLDDDVSVPPLVERRAVIPRPEGIARRCSILSGYSGGKSDFLGHIVAPLMMCPEVAIDLIGMTYDNAEPEFKYIRDCLFSADGFNLPMEKPKTPGIYKQRMTNPRPGVMPEIVLSNGSILRVVSYDNKENLKGKERDAYVFAEYFMFPGFEAYTDIAQNLDKGDRRGFAFFATTPDSPHVEMLITMGKDPESPLWHTTMNVARSKNPYAFSFHQLEEDRKSKTREKFKIGQLGMIGEYVGSAFNYKRGQRLFTPRTHRHLWKNPDGQATRENLKVPDSYAVIGGADTGSHYAAAIAMFSDDERPHMFIIDEIANYRYVATEIEKSPNYTISQWYQDMLRMSDRYGGDRTFWADANAQLKHDAAVAARIALLPDHTGPEARTEILREYFQNDRIWFAPWLEIIPYECEMARFPPAGTSTGIWRRISEKDHALDPVEHMAAQRPAGHKRPPKRKRLFIEEYLNMDLDHNPSIDPHFR